MLKHQILEKIKNETQTLDLVAKNMFLISWVQNDLYYIHTFTVQRDPLILRFFQNIGFELMRSLSAKVHKGVLYIQILTNVRFSCTYEIGKFILVSQGNIFLMNNSKY